MANAAFLSTLMISFILKLMYLFLTPFSPSGNDLTTLENLGAWRSLVAYLNGVQRAGGSNPLAPTNKIRGADQIIWFAP